MDAISQRSNVTGSGPVVQFTDCTDSVIGHGIRRRGTRKPSKQATTDPGLGTRTDLAGWTKAQREAQKQRILSNLAFKTHTVSEQEEEGVGDHVDKPTNMSFMSGIDTAASQQLLSTPPIDPLHHEPYQPSISDLTLQIDAHHHASYEPSISDLTLQLDRATGQNSSEAAKIAVQAAAIAKAAAALADKAAQMAMGTAAATASEAATNQMDNNAADASSSDCRVITTT
jgi:hypothetical protein